MSFEEEESYGAIRRVQRPDDDAHKQAANDCEKRISKLKQELAVAQSAISNATGGGGDKSEFQMARAAKKQIVDELFTKKKELSDQRNGLLDQIKRIQGDVRKKGDALKSSKDKMPYRSVKELTDQITSLEAQLSSGKVTKLIEEKRIVQEISTLKKHFKTLNALGSQQSSVTNDKADIDELRAKLNLLDPLRSSLNTDLDAAKGELNAFEAERKEAVGGMTDLFNVRNKIKEDLDAEYDDIKSMRSEHKAAKDAWYVYQRADWERKNLEIQARKKEERIAKLSEDAEAELEAAEIPAFSEEISLCATLVKYFSVYETKVAEVAVVEKEAKVMEGMVALKKKDGREEDFMMMSKKGKKNKGNKSAAQTSTTKAIKLDLELLNQLSKLKIDDIPTSVADVPKIIEAIHAKRADFEKRQDKETEGNKRRAEEKIKKLQAKSEAIAAGLEEEAVEAVEV